MTDSVRRTPVRSNAVAMSPTSTTTAAVRPASRSGAAAQAVTGSTTIGTKPSVRTTPVTPATPSRPRAITQERPNFTITPSAPRTTVPAVGDRSLRLPGTSTGSELPSGRSRPAIGTDGELGTTVTTASASDVVDGLDKGRQLFIQNPEDGGGATAAPGLGEAADAIEQGSKSTADALKDAMPHLDDAGADELAKLMKTAAAAKGVSVAALVLSVGDVALNWKNHGLDDPRTQDSLASLVGGSAGTAIGAALGGPLGAALGGMIGSYLGPKVADFARDLADRYGEDVKEAVGEIADGVKAIGSSIADAADAVGDVLGDLWDGVFGDGGLIDDITLDIDIPFF